MSVNSRAPREFTGRHMALVMALFFGTIISVNVTMAYFAESTWSGLVVENSYVASQTFDADTAKREQEVARGWDARVAYADGQFRVDFVDAAGKPVTDAAASVTIGHPVNANFDRTLTLEPVAGGGYGAKTQLTSGRWEARLVLTAEGLTPWHRAVRFSVE
ncbi:FixH family protein [Aurantimonas sp. VKM B-3413]|uniref:FixH family protein n=1 Tax=Aurantimonas sp. VKM B-3413 TaxID=2779401 RepID=UPI001E4F357A|nr:FixH family protein [Aurantimonas sp. VKM B-3413]MCB8838588.1 FixH family protein [Aurantimonas sp. VKM B-3413]